MPFHYWLTVIFVLSLILAGSVFAAKVGWATYLECKDQPDEYWGEEGRE